MKIKIKRLSEFSIIPKYMTPGSSGMDLYSVEDVDIRPGQTSVVDVGLSFELPVGVEMQIRSRSGMAAKHAVVVANSPGTVDSDFRGPVKVILVNNGAYTFKVLKGDRVAQCVIATYEVADLVEYEDLSETDRGSGGLGSTGK